MSENLSVSLLMAVYNEERFLAEALDSLLRQTLSDFELIIVNDGSTDSTPGILREYRERDSRIKIINNSENLGLPASLNKGLEAAGGKYIARHDADDIAFPERLSIQFRFMESHPEIFLCGSQARFIDSEGAPGQYYCVPLNHSRIARAPLKQKNCLIHSSWFFRNEGYRYRDKFKYSQDFELMSRFISDGKIIVSLPQILLLYRISGKNQNLSKRLLQTLNRVSIKKFYLERSAGEGDSYSEFIQDGFSEPNRELGESRDFFEPRLRVHWAFSPKGPVTKSLLKTGKSRFGLKSVFPYLLINLLPVWLIGRLKKVKSMADGRTRTFSPSFSLLMSLGMGIADWKRTGSLDRELALYRKLSERGWDINIFSFDSEKITPIGNLAVESRYPFKAGGRFRVFYYLLMPFIKRRTGKKSSLIITNQSHLAWPVLLLHFFWKTPYIARCGYVFGERSEVLQSKGLAIRKRIFFEQQVLKHSHSVIVPTRELGDWVVSHYGIPVKNVNIIPNYVDTGVFFPDSSNNKEYDIISVGRLSPVKHHEWIIQALENTDLRILIVGRGREKNVLKKKAEELGVRAEFRDSVDNRELGQLFRKSRLYINCSDWEGHPKALLEAMACGLPCIVRKTPGLRPFIDCGRAFDAGDSSDKLAAVISQVLSLKFSESWYKDQFGFVKREFGLENIADKYEDCIRDNMMEFYE